MADTLSNGHYSITFDAGTTSDDADRLNQVVDEVVLGTTKFPAISADLSSGTGANQANKVWGKTLTINATTNTVPNLFDGSLMNGRNQSLAFTNVRRILLRVRAPAAGKKITVGGAATSWCPWLSANTTTEDVASVLLRESDIDGWTVSNTAKLLMLANPGATPVQLDIVIVGK